MVQSPMMTFIMSDTDGVLTFKCFPSYVKTRWWSGYTNQYSPYTDQMFSEDLEQEHKKHVAQVYQIKLLSLCTV